MNIRSANEADVASVATLMNSHNQSVDAQVSSVDNDSALAFINGYFEPSAAFVLEGDESSNFAVAINLHPDSHRQRFQVELFCDPEYAEVKDVVGWVIQKAESIQPGWSIRPGANARDTRLIEAWSHFGYGSERRFSVMRLELDEVPVAHVRDDISISAIDTSDDSQLRTWHALHQDAFASHYGFTPRPFEEWIQMVTRDPNFDPQGVLVGTVRGEPFGFCHHTDEFSGNSRGFVIGLGVAQSQRGFGYGEALLNAGIAYSISKGYSSIELAVDTGNESGALRLYEKAGFQVTSAWVHLAKQG